MIREDCLDYFKGWVCTKDSVYISEYHPCCRRDCHITDCTNCANYEKQDSIAIIRELIDRCKKGGIE